MKPTKEQIEADILTMREHGLGTAFDLHSILFALTYLKLSMGEVSEGMIRCTEPNECALYKSCIYKDMRDQLLKETEEALK